MLPLAVDFQVFFSSFLSNSLSINSLDEFFFRLISVGKKYGNEREREREIIKIFHSCVTCLMSSAAAAAQQLKKSINYLFMQFFAFIPFVLMIIIFMMYFLGFPSNTIKYSEFKFWNDLENETWIKKCWLKRWSLVHKFKIFNVSKCIINHWSSDALELANEWVSEREKYDLGISLK